MATLSSYTKTTDFTGAYLTGFNSANQVRSFDPLYLPISNPAQTAFDGLQGQIDDIVTDYITQADAEATFATRIQPAAVSTNRALTDTDANTRIEVTAGTTLTLPSGLSSDFAVDLIPAGSLTITGSGGATVNGSSSITITGDGKTAFKLAQKAAGGDAFTLLDVLTAANLTTAGGLLAKNSIFADTVYNIKASNTGKFRSAALRTDINPIVLFVGNSTMRGLVVGGGSSQGVSSWANYTASMLNLRIPASANSIIGIDGWGGAATMANMMAGDARVSATTGTVPSVNFTSIGGSSYIMGAAGASVTFSPAEQCTHIDVIYSTRNSAAGGVFGWSIDGGSVTNINTNTGTEAFARTNVFAGTLGLHSIKLEWVSGGSTNIFGIIAYNNSGTRKELIFINASISGASSTNLLNDAGQPYSRRNAAKALSPSLAFVEGGIINDWRQSTAIATSKANIKSLCQDYLLTGDVILVVPIFDGATSGQAPNQAAYVTAMYEIADELDIGLIDIRKLWLSYTNGNTLGFYSDLTHGSVRGYKDQGRLGARILTDIIG